jgi:hypothetical protein
MAEEYLKRPSTISPAPAPETQSLFARMAGKAPKTTSDQSVAGGGGPVLPPLTNPPTAPAQIQPAEQPGIMDAVSKGVTSVLQKPISGLGTARWAADLLDKAITGNTQKAGVDAFIKAIVPFNLYKPDALPAPINAAESRVRKAEETLGNIGGTAASFLIPGKIVTFGLSKIPGAIKAVESLAKFPILQKVVNGVMHNVPTFALRDQVYADIATGPQERWDIAKDSAKSGVMFGAIPALEKLGKAGVALEPLAVFGIGYGGDFGKQDLSTTDRIVSGLSLLLMHYGGKANNMVSAKEKAVGVLEAQGFKPEQAVAITDKVAETVAPSKTTEPPAAIEQQRPVNIPETQAKVEPVEELSNEIRPESERRQLALKLAKEDGIPDAEALVDHSIRVANAEKNAYEKTVDPVTGKSVNSFELMDILESEGKPRMGVEFSMRRGYTKAEYADLVDFQDRLTELRERGASDDDVMYITGVATGQLRPGKESTGDIPYWSEEKPVDVKTADLPTLRTTAESMGLQKEGTAKGLRDRVDEESRLRSQMPEAEPAGAPLVEASGKQAADRLAQRIIDQKLEDPTLTEEQRTVLKDQKKNATHDQLTNEEVTAFATTEIAKDPVAAERRVLSGEVSAEVSAMAGQLREKYLAEGKNKEADAIDEHMNKLGRESGRGIQALKLYLDAETPSGFLRSVQRVAEHHGITITPESATNIVDLRRQQIQAKDNATKDAVSQQLVDAVAEAVPTTWWEKLTLYRLSNALSGPRGTERNMFQNAFAMNLKYPITLALRGRPVEAARFLFDSWRNLDNANKAFVDAMKGFDFGKFQEGMNTGSIEEMRLSKTKVFGSETIGKAIQVIPKFYGAQDQWFATMIKQGEKLRMMRNGAPEEVAEKQASRLSEAYLLRQQSGSEMKDKNAPLFGRALDSVSNLVTMGTKAPIIGKPLQLINLFVRTPFNFAKAMITESPLGFVSEKYKLPKDLSPEQRTLAKEKLADQRARAAMGTLITAAGGLLAIAGRTTANAPTDPKEKELWFATGRKPWSVKIGNQWIPMWYLGPAAFALAIPASARDAFVDNPRMAGTSTGEKMVKTATGLARFVSSQTTLAQQNSLLRWISGDEDRGAMNTAAFSLEQFVPISSFIRYVSTIVDPTMRKSSGFKDTFLKSMPWISKNVEPYLDPDGKEATRSWQDYVLPYTSGTVEPKFEKPMQDRLDKLSVSNEKQAEFKTLLESKPNRWQANDWINKNVTGKNAKDIKESLRRIYTTESKKWKK